jgi:hypothetical protein
MNNYLRIIAISSACIFLGRAYNYLFWGSPIRVLFWDQELFSPIVEGVFGMTWEVYVTNTQMSTYLEWATFFGGFFFIGCAMLSVVILYSLKRYWRSFLYVGSAILCVHALLDMKDHFYHYAQFFEHGIQIGTPLLLGYAIFHQERKKRILFFLKVLVAATFTAHGLYAIGFHPVPVHFVDMTIRILQVEEGTARLFLKVVGILDLMLSVGLFIPKVDRYALIYATGWGFLTALARIVYGFDWDFLGYSLHGYAYQTVFRLAHGLIPLAGVLLIREMRSKKVGLETVDVAV